MLTTVTEVIEDQTTNFVKLVSNFAASVSPTWALVSIPILIGLFLAVDHIRCKQEADEVLKQGIELSKIIYGCAQTISEVGEKFEEGVEVFQKANNEIKTHTSFFARLLAPTHEESYAEESNAKRF